MKTSEPFKKSPFLVQTLNSVLVVEFNSPDSSNAFGSLEAKELNKLTTYALKNNLQGLILTSPNRIFCSGGNLKMYAKKTKAESLKINLDIKKNLSLFQKSPLPTITCVEGDCLGGGLEVLSAFDQVYTAPHSLFGFWQRKIGLTWGWGGGMRLMERTSNKQLWGLALKAKTISSYEALRLGLVDQIYPREMLLLKALQNIHQQARLPKEPMVALKKISLKKWSEILETQIFQKLWHNPSHRDALKKFKK